MILEQMPVSSLQPDQVFLCRHGLLYRYLGGRVASLIRLADGAEPVHETATRFSAREVVELVPRLRKSSTASVQHQV
ncbi:hypothetical protein [Planctomycetes bacterium K23_9]|uniref:Uncharacterized protein n=1 Tax=Stieleria marina TaxID=1930275 RepID=A0A517NWB8_9BACT|nr:hypothetical protein K239x_34180 [Planctomycetes bacterium K23_9]